MKILKHKFAIMIGVALLMPMAIVVSMTSAPKAPTVAISDDKATPIILASAHSLVRVPSTAASLLSTQFKTLPVPCPIWMLSELTGHNTKTSESTNGGKRNPQLVPAGIWFMQKFAEALRKPL